MTLERDFQNEWQFVRSNAREKIKFTPTLTAHGDALREAALAGCGIVRHLGCHIENDMRSGLLLRALPDRDCLGGLPIVAIYRKSKPSLSPIDAVVGQLAQAFLQVVTDGARSLGSGRQGRNLVDQQFSLVRFHDLQA